MKLVSFLSATAEPRIGLVANDSIVDLARRLPDAPRDMMGLIAAWPQWQPSVLALSTLKRGDVPLQGAALLAPVPRPGKIFGIGLNYADHIAESGMAKPIDQIWFSKAVTAVNGPFSAIELPRISAQLDYEAELALVIGKRCRHMEVEHAAEVIFGYCAANDVSVRDWQLKTSQFVLGKSFDSHCPYGPWIVTPDELGDPHQLRIQCFVNGELRQHSNTRELIYNCFEQVAYLSRVMTLEPGDVILTGTPGGVGMGSKPPRWLRAGDVVRVDIEGIGTIENRVEAERS
jgi:2-keto-4-pentenoate hydratase/2-oxohepta-3-ene-1,7-dioic acid hydratase in catechol pathway